MSTAFKILYLKRKVRWQVTFKFVYYKLFPTFNKTRRQNTRLKLTLLQKSERGKDKASPNFLVLKAWNTFCRVPVGTLRRQHKVTCQSQTNEALRSLTQSVYFCMCISSIKRWYRTGVVVRGMRSDFEWCRYGWIRKCHAHIQCMGQARPVAPTVIFKWPDHDVGVLNLLPDAAGRSNLNAHRAAGM